MKQIIMSLAFCLFLGLWHDAGLAVAQVQVQVSKTVVKLGGEKVLLHQIRKGQTVFAIAKAYNVDIEEIYKANPSAKDGLTADRSLVIPFHDPNNKRQHSDSKSINQYSDQNNRQINNKGRDVESTVQQSSNQQDNSKEKRDKEQQTKINEQHSYNQLVKPGQGQKSPLNQSDLSAKIPTETFFDSTLYIGNEVDTAICNEMDASFTGELAEFDPSRLKIALYLPFGEPGNRSNENFADFYEGFLLAMDQLKKDGISAEVNLFSSSLSIDTSALSSVNLIVGPVYEDAARPVVEYATNHAIAVVSPLSDFKELSSAYLFQAAPIKEHKYDKVGKILTENPAANVIMILPTIVQEGGQVVGGDQELIEAVDKLGKSLSISKLLYSKETPITSLSGMLSKSTENILIVPINKESQVEQVLSRIASINTTGRYQIRVIGSSSWGKFENINLDLFFKLSVNYVTSYHADRSSKVVRRFYSNYADSFGSIPSLFSFRGYDVGVFFGGALSEYGAKMPLKIADYQCDNLLDVKYQFVRESVTGSFKNREWMVTEFQPNYTIIMK